MKATTYLGIIWQNDPDAARALIIRMLTECGGSPVAASRAMGIPRWQLYQNLYKLGLRGKPGEIKQQLKNRFCLKEEK